VILPADEDIAKTLSSVRDSKQLSSAQREEVRILIENISLTWAVGWADNGEIDLLGIVPATRLAVWRALEKLNPTPDHLLVDYIVLPDISLPQTRLVKGDARSLSIAAASILAKTHRDSLMTAFASTYPSYGFDKHKGYGTAMHRQVIQSRGSCPLHRMSFAPLRTIED
jgi:ribonuclease HII